jgi:hypothetical protein
MKKVIIAFAAIAITSTTSFAQAKDAKKCGAIAYFGTHTGTSEISSSELASVNEYTVKDPCDEKVSGKVESFEFTAVINSKPTVIMGKGSEVTAEMKKVFTQLKSGDKVFLDSFKAKMVDGSMKKIPGITLKIK